MTPVVTDGPFAETKEFLAGYWIVDVESPERAVEIAAHISAAPGPGGGPLNMPIEVRQVMCAPTAGAVTAEHRSAASRTCCASWRRRSSACSPAASATSPPPRTRCRRRCSPPRPVAAEGVPENPRGWLIQVAYRRMIEHVRSEQARRRREDLVARRDPDDRRLRAGRRTSAVDRRPGRHAGPAVPVLPPGAHPASAIALTLRAVGGLTTAEIARAFLVPEATMAQRISRAKQRIKASGVPFRMPGDRRSGPSGSTRCCTCST